MRIPFFQIDAFTTETFGGNPAAVCPLERWLPETCLQAIAAENNLSETAFFVASDDGYELRWFTPTVEVDLCGHATLAAAHVLFERLAPGCSELNFSTRVAGTLSVEKVPTGSSSGPTSRLVLDVPARIPDESINDDRLVRISAALGGTPDEVCAARDWMAVYPSEQHVAALTPNFEAIRDLGCFAIIATAPADAGEIDFISRFFAPAVGVPEDPVTGSAHASLVPYWARRLDKSQLRARQISTRGGDLYCELRGDRVRIGGNAVFTIEGTFHLDDALLERHENDPESKA